MTRAQGPDRQVSIEELPVGSERKCDCARHLVAGPLQGRLVKLRREDGSPVLNPAAGHVLIRVYHRPHCPERTP